jgi:cytosine/adenosine deaminase-related metal-dependent hydrolase
MQTLIRDATVITVDGQRTVLSPGAVVVRGNTITDIGPSEAVASRTTRPDRVVDGRGKVVLPGFVSAHNHVGYAVFRGRAEDIGYAPTQRLYMPMSPVISRPEREAVGRLAIAELLRGGMTTILEMEEDADLFAPFIERVGMRAAMGVMVHDVDINRLVAGDIVFDVAVRDRQLGQAVAFAEAWHGKAEGRITAMMTANGLASSSPALLRALRDAAGRLSLRLSIHIGTGEEGQVRDLHGIGSFQYAREHGFLAEDVVAVHCYRASDADVQAMADAGAHLAHCPFMNAFRGAIAPVQDLRARGVNVGLGIDNYFSDYFDVMRSCIAVARIRAHDPEVMPANEVLELATIDAARALGLHAITGSLEVGKRADLQIVDMRRYGLTPTNDALRTLVYHAHAKDVETVMVDGRIVVRDGRVVGEDEQALLDAAALASDSAWERFVARYRGYATPRSA